MTESNPSDFERPNPSLGLSSVDPLDRALRTLPVPAASADWALDGEAFARNVLRALQRERDAAVSATSARTISGADAIRRALLAEQRGRARARAVWVGFRVGGALAALLAISPLLGPTAARAAFDPLQFAAGSLVLAAALVWAGLRL